MEIYFIYLIFLISLFFLNKYLKVKSSQLLGIGIIGLILIASFRALSVGSDTETYKNLFDWIEYYKDDRGYVGLQYPWFLYSYFFYRILNFDWFLISSYIIICGSIGYFIKRESQCPLLSLILFYLIFFLPSLNIMRQYIAIGLMSLGYIYLSEKRCTYFLILTIISSTFHFSALIMIPLVFLPNINLSKSFIILAIILSFIFGVCLDIAKPITKLFTFVGALNEGALSYIDNINNFSSRNIVTNLIMNIVFLLSYILSKNKCNIYIKLWFFYILLRNFFGASGQGERIFLYLFISIIVVIPNIYKSLQNKTLSHAYLLLVLVYGIGYWYTLMATGAGEVVPYKLRNYIQLL